MYKRTVIQVLGFLLLFLGGILSLIGIVESCFGASSYLTFFKSAGLSAGTGLVFWLTTRKTPMHLATKEGFAIVSLGWVILTFFSSLPFCFYTPSSGYVFSFTDAYFETMSGLTTTGASILNNIEQLPRGLLLWRSMTHWLGGMGIVVLFLAVLPALGAGGFQLFRAEIPGPTKDKISPKIGNTAKTLWVIYLGLTLAEISLLYLADMSLYESVCHTFGTVATGGFSTRNGSVADFQSWQIDLIITVFMFLSGCNFLLLLQVKKGKPLALFKSSEFLLYCTFIAIGIFMITALNYVHGQPEKATFFNTLRYAAFQVVSIITSTGYATKDYDLWPVVCQIYLFMLMFVGACAGSTGGGMKVFRILMAFKVGFCEIFQLLRPRATLQVKVDGNALGEELVRVVLGFVCLYLLLFGFSCVVVIAIEGDRFNMMSLISICISCLSNIGPGLEQFGPTDNYAPLTDLTKWILTFLMLLGRLELYSVLVLFHPDIWRK